MRRIPIGFYFTLAALIGEALLQVSGVHGFWWTVAFVVLFGASLIAGIVEGAFRIRAWANRLTEKSNQLREDTKRLETALGEAEQERNKFKEKYEELIAEQRQKEQRGQHLAQVARTAFVLEGETVIGRRLLAEGSWDQAVNASARGSLTIEDAVARQARTSAELPARNAVRRFYSERITDEELQQRCQELSEEIYEFLADRERNDPHRGSWLEERHLSTEEEKRRHRERTTEETERYFNKTMNQYKRDFHGRAIALLYAATERGACTPEEFSRWDARPVTTYQIEEVATCLSAVGNRP